MTVMQIPKEHLEGFNALAALEAKDYDGFRERLRILAPQDGALGLKELQDRMKKWAPSTDTPTLNAILGLFMNLISSDELGDDFRTSFIRAYELQGGLQSSRLLERVNELFEDAEGLRCTLKGVSLMREAEHRYDSSRILTDMRPVFNNHDAFTRGNYAIIMHRLKLVRNDSDDQRTIYLSMTRSQLEDLQKVIGRAIEKDDSLRKNAGYRFID